MYCKYVNLNRMGKMCILGNCYGQCFHLMLKKNYKVKVTYVREFPIKIQIKKMNYILSRRFPNPVGCHN